MVPVIRSCHSPIWIWLVNCLHLLLLLHVHSCSCARKFVPSTCRAGGGGRHAGWFMIILARSRVSVRSTYCLPGFQLLSRVTTSLSMAVPAPCTCCHAVLRDANTLPRDDQNVLHVWLQGQSHGRSYSYTYGLRPTCQGCALITCTASTVADLPSDAACTYPHACRA